MGKKAKDAEMITVQAILTDKEAKTLLEAYGGENVGEAILHLLYHGEPPKESLESIAITPTELPKDRHMTGLDQ